VPELVRDPSPHCTTRAPRRHAIAGLRTLSRALCAGLALLYGAPALAADSAVVVMYHRFGESAYPSTNITLAQFEAHLAELKDEAYHVLPVPEILAAVREGRELPDRTIGITVDDAFLSVYTEAWPRLRQAGLPFTLFVATDAIDAGFRDYMSWNQLRELRDAGVAIGSQTASHLHMAANDAARNRDELKRSNERFVAELGARPDLIAYPFGEASGEVQRVAREVGFVMAFGQHSGVIHATADPFYLPRFSLNEAFGDIDRFRLVANALPIPFTDLTPSDPLLTVNPPPFGFTLKQPDMELPGLACYAVAQGQVQADRLGPRVEVRLVRPFQPGRGRINCTARTRDGRWRWLGMQYYVQRG
jgi:peptidoglycan/xylan/chitin deacetylase (PgdA/CDA1 family)